MRLGLWVGAVAFLVATTAQAGSLGALKGELKRLEGIASEWAPLAEAGEAWCKDVSGEAYVAFARDVGLTADTAAVVFDGKKRLLDRVAELRRRLRSLDQKRRRCNEVDRWNADRRVLAERAQTEAVATVDDLRIALDRWKTTFGTTSPPEFTATCAAIMSAALTPTWPDHWRDIDDEDLRRRANVTGTLPECGSASAEAGRVLHATRSVVRNLRAADDAAQGGDALRAEEILQQTLSMWPPDSRYPKSVGQEQLAGLARASEYGVEDRVEACRVAPEECSFANVRRDLKRLVAKDESPSRARFVVDQLDRLQDVEVGWVRSNRRIFGGAETLSEVSAQRRWMAAERPQLQSRVARVALDAWEEELTAGSVGLQKQRVSLLGGTEVRLEGHYLCGTDGLPLGTEWGPRGETQARIRRFIRDLRDETGLREPSAVLRAAERKPGTPSDEAPRCEQRLLLTAELTSCAVDTLFGPEMPTTLDRDYGQATGARMGKNLLSPLRALMPADGYSIRLKNRAGRTFMIELNQSGTRPREYLDGVHLNPQGTEAIPIEYVDVIRSVLADVVACP